MTVPPALQDKEMVKFKEDTDGFPAVNVIVVAEGTDPLALPNALQDRENQKFTDDTDGNPAVRVILAPGSIGGGGGVSQDYVDTHLGGDALDETGKVKNNIVMWDGSKFVVVPAGTTFTFSIASFTHNAGSTSILISTGTWKSAGSLSFSATYNNGPATDGYVSHTGWTNLTLTGAGFNGPTVSTQDVNYPASPGGTQAFTLHATDGTDNPTSTITFSFVNLRFWGITTVTGTFVEADIEGLASNELSNSKGKTFTVTAGSGDYIAYSYPKRLGTVVFTVGGFEGGFEAPQTVSVTNTGGYVEDYYIYRSTQDNLGTTTVVVV